jgi:DNA-binding GntR family transcriptional regulator
MARLKSNSSIIAFEFIKDRINKYDYKPGDTISDLSISEELKMSRTPVREAIMNLVQLNLVEKQKTKFAVKNITIDDILEILEVRQAIETMSVKLIIELGGLTKKQYLTLEEIEKNLARSLESNHYYDNFKYDSLFHRTLVGFCGNSRLISIMDTMSIQGERLRLLSILTPGRYKDAIEEHRQIIEAIKEKDLAQASNRISDHLKLTKENYIRITSESSWEAMIFSLKKAFELT